MSALDNFKELNLDTEYGWSERLAGWAGDSQKDKQIQALEYEHEITALEAAHFARRQRIYYQAFRDAGFSAREAQEYALDNYRRFITLDLGQQKLYADRMRSAIEKLRDRVAELEEKSA